MTHDVSWFDRLRIERVVWLLDQRLYDLPRGSRIGHRREVRANLLSAAHDVGATAALRQLGNSRQLAEGYLTAEFGDHPRHSWIGAAWAAMLVPLVAIWVLAEAILTFRHGITTADPHATGTYHWAGLPYVQSSVTYTMVDGKGTYVGGALTPPVYVGWLVTIVAVGRLWRIPAAWRRRRRLEAAGAAAA